MAIIPPVIVVMEKACRSAAQGLVRDFGELEKLQISKKDKNDFVSSADLRASESIRCLKTLINWLNLRFKPKANIIKITPAGPASFTNSIYIPLKLYLLILEKNS